jgi:hypothetical protein
VTKQRNRGAAEEEISAEVFEEPIEISGGAERGRTAASQFCRTPQNDNDEVRQSEIEGDVNRKNRGD